MCLLKFHPRKEVLLPGLLLSRNTVIIGFLNPIIKNYEENAGILFVEKVFFLFFVIEYNRFSNQLSTLSTILIAKITYGFMNENVCTCQSVILFKILGMSFHSALKQIPNPFYSPFSHTITFYN